MDGGTTYVHTLPIQKQKIDNDKGSTNGFKINSSYTQGANIFTGVCEDGDHLFVNRLIYNLRNPKRGDISVFMTKGILDKDKKLRGQFYIKRLVGLPNETLRIKREPGQKYGKLFKVIDGKEVAVSEKDHPAFKKIYSGENGYHGHSRAFKLGYNWPTLTAQGDNIVLADTRFVHNGTEFIAESKDTTWFKHKLKIENDKFILYTSEEEVIFTNSQGIVKLTDIIRKDGYEAHFKNEYDEFKLGKDQFFMMGDNSDHSLDSRYWGPVPRKNLIGTAASVFWPFSHRWGMADNNKLQKIKTKQEGKF
jgi:signal peptidase I